MKYKYYWIMERHNPQLGVYYIAMGNISAKDAESKSSVYGWNHMLKFDSEKEYKAKISDLIEKGERVQQ